MSFFRLSGRTFKSVTFPSFKRGGTPAEKEEAQERKEFVNHMYNKKL